MTTEEVKEVKVDPLEKMRCAKSDCANDRHYFLATQKMRNNNELPRCRDCGADLIDWNQVRKCDLKEVKKTFELLKYEWVRHVYWHRKIDQKAINYALRKGKVELYATAEHIIRKNIAKPADICGNFATSWEGNAVHYAQHATATCCRKCIEKWYGIPLDQTLTKDQIIYFTQLVILYLQERFPDLPNDGQKVPPIRKVNRLKKQKGKNDH